jgi:alkanesulfonate monooxygenase SsuD/methylene tetrahydromethanopterin reductase-like flavin-dependent oxidoreductase (luciferase family)
MSGSSTTIAATGPPVNARARAPGSRGGAVVRVDRAGFGVMLPTFDPFRTGPPPLARGAALAEDLGFDAGWVGDGWLGVWMSPRRVREAAGRLAELAAELDRPVPAVLMMVFVHVLGPGDDPAAARAEAAALVRGQYGLPFDALERWVVIGDEHAVADALGALLAAGAAGFVLLPAASAPLQQYERLASVRALVEAGR